MKTVERSALCRSRRELSNEYLLANFGFDTAENEPCKVCPLSAYGSPRCNFQRSSRKFLGAPLVSPSFPEKAAHFYRPWLRESAAWGVTEPRLEVSFTHIVKASEPVVSAVLMAVMMNKIFPWCPAFFRVEARRLINIP